MKQVMHSQHSLIGNDECCSRCQQDQSSSSSQSTVVPVVTDNPHYHPASADPQSSASSSAVNRNISNQAVQGAAATGENTRSNRQLSKYELYEAEEEDDDEEEEEEDEVNEWAQLTGPSVGRPVHAAIIVSNSNRVTYPLMLNSFVTDVDKQQQQHGASTETSILMDHHSCIREPMFDHPSLHSSLSGSAHNDHQNRAISPSQHHHHHHHYQNHLPVTISPTHSQADPVSSKSSSSSSPDCSLPLSPSIGPSNASGATTMTTSNNNSSDMVPCSVSPLLTGSLSPSPSPPPPVAPPVVSVPNNNRHYHHRVSSCISVQSASSQCSSDSSLSDYPPNTPICKFCHQRAKSNDPLISPCYCKGTIRYMHCRCLMKWLDKLKKRNSRNHPPSCEICNYEYCWKKKFKPARMWQLPPCSSNDRRWHSVFVVCALLMIISMLNLIIFGDEDSRQRAKNTEYSGSRFSDSFARSASSGAFSTLFANANANNNKNGSTSNSYFLLSPNASILLNISDSNSQDVSTLLANLSAALPALQNMNLIPNRTQTKQSHSRKKSHLPPPSSSVSAPTSTSTSESDVRHRHQQQHEQQSYGYRLNNERRRRRNLPTKPSEVILVVSGCLFFITFFLGTFAQIKSEVSFYTLVVRFIHWNQEWIIEEYDPDDGTTTSTNAVNNSSSGGGSSSGVGATTTTTDSTVLSSGLVVVTEPSSLDSAMSSCSAAAGAATSAMHHIKDNHPSNEPSSFGLDSGPIMTMMGSASGTGKLHVMDL